MEINLKRIDDAYKMEATNESGHTVHSDGSLAIGGKNSAMRPMQMLLASLGSCSSIDVINFLQKLRQPLDDIQIKVTGEREEGKVPSLFTKINVHYKLYGDLDVKQAEKAISLSMDKYCSVGLIIKKSAEITWSYEIIKSS